MKKNIFMYLSLVANDTEIAKTGAPYFRRRRCGWELASKPAIPFEKSWGGATVE